MIFRQRNENMETNKTIPAGVSAIQIDGQRIEYAPIDLALAYASIAPLVTEAYAYFKSGKRNEAEEAIEKARAKIEMATMLEGMIVSNQPEPENSSSDCNPEVQVTSRGFEIVEFEDSHEDSCSLQQSSAADGYYVWLGKTSTGNRMHLNASQVEMLVMRLQNWLATGSFKTIEP